MAIESSSSFHCDVEKFAVSKENWIRARFYHEMCWTGQKNFIGESFRNWIEEKLFLCQSKLNASKYGLFLISVSFTFTCVYMQFLHEVIHLIILIGSSAEISCWCAVGGYYQSIIKCNGNYSWLEPVAGSRIKVISILRFSVIPLSLYEYIKVWKCQAIN